MHNMYDNNEFGNEYYNCGDKTGYGGKDHGHKDSGRYFNCFCREVRPCPPKPCPPKPCPPRPCPPKPCPPKPCPPKPCPPKPCPPKPCPPSPCECIFMLAAMCGCFKGKRC